MKEHLTSKDCEFVSDRGDILYPLPWLHDYDSALSLGFAWDGDWNHPVLVDYGGWQEPVVAMFMLEDPENEEDDSEEIAFNSRFDEVLKYFKKMCRDFSRKWEDEQ